MKRHDRTEGPNLPGSDYKTSRGTGCGDHARLRGPARHPCRSVEGLGDFSRRLGATTNLDATFDFIGVSSYGNRPSPSQELKSGWDSTGEVKLTKDVDQSMKDKN